MSDRFEAFDRRTLANYLGTSMRYIEDLDHKREGPPRVKIGGRWRYPVHSVKGWIVSRTHKQRNAPPGPA